MSNFCDAFNFASKKSGTWFSFNPNHFLQYFYDWAITGSKNERKTMEHFFQKLLEFTDKGEMYERLLKETYCGGA